MVWPCFEQRHSTGHNEWKKKKRYAEKRWEDNIKEWTGMNFVSSTTAAVNKTRWKGIVEKSFIKWTGIRMRVYFHIFTTLPSLTRFFTLPQHKHTDR